VRILEPEYFQGFFKNCTTCKLALNNYSVAFRAAETTYELQKIWFHNCTKSIQKLPILCWSAH